MEDKKLTETDLNKFMENRDNELSPKTLEEFDMSRVCTKRVITVSGNPGKHRDKIIQRICTKISDTRVHVISDVYHEYQRFKNLTQDSYCLTTSESIDKIHQISQENVKNVIVVNSRYTMDSKPILDMIQTGVSQNITLVLVCGNLTPIPQIIKKKTDLFFFIEPNSIRTLHVNFKRWFCPMCPKWCMNQYFFRKTFQKYISRGSCVVMDEGNLMWI